MEQTVRQENATPATVGVVDGRLQIGLTPEQLAFLAKESGLRKISLRDFGPSVAQGASGGTTVAGTMWASSLVGIRVFATGGIGGVHRRIQASSSGVFDISTDLQALASIPVIVVCAGAKAILDLPATLEYLETVGVPVVGYQTQEFPAFYCRTSGLATSSSASTPEEIVEIAQAHWVLGLPSAILVVVPPPAEAALPAAVVDEAVEQALEEAGAQGIVGQAVTPFLLARVSQITGGASLKTNLALLLNNAGVAARIARALVSH